MRYELNLGLSREAAVALARRSSDSRFSPTVPTASATSTSACRSGSATTRRAAERSCRAGGVSLRPAASSRR